MGEKRVDIKVGLGCNNNCLFCVQANKRGVPDKDTELIKTQIKESRDNCSSIVFTGGEPTIRKDIFELVSYAKELGFNIIQIQTNGRMLAYKDFCRKMIDAGATEFSPALHGHVPELHDFLTRSEGSFNHTVQAIRNLKSLHQMVITNTVVVKPNYRNLPDIARLLVSLGVDQFQFAFVHALGNAWDNFDSIVPRVSLAAPYIKRGLQIGIDAKIPVMAEAIPYCQMSGYENYVSEKFIPDSEIQDMNYKIPDYRKTRITEGKIKFPQCEQCRYDKICEGPWKEYPEKLGSDEFQPVR